MSLHHFLQQSRATDAFKSAVRDFVRGGRPTERIAFDLHSPAIKVERALTKLLEEMPEAEIDRVEIRGASGCEFYRGEMTVHTAEEKRRVRFYWDCKWRAVQQGWSDYFGFPDQARAAREFGHDCFREWASEGVEQAIPAV